MKIGFALAAAMMLGTMDLSGTAFAMGCGADHVEAAHGKKAEAAAYRDAGPEVHSMDIVEIAVSAGSFNTLVAAVRAAGLVETLQGEGPFTLFAPTDAAFAKLPEGTVESLLEPGNRSRLQAILTYHVVPGKVLSADVLKIDSARTVQGEDLTVRASDGKVMVDDAEVTRVDLLASNGVIHVIDSVMLPKDQ